MHLFLHVITNQTICLRAELLTLAARLLLSQGFPSLAGLPFVQEDTWSSFEKDLPPFPLPPDLYSHGTRQGLPMCKWDFSTVLWNDSFIATIMSAFILFHGRGRVVALFCLVAPLICWLLLCLFGLSVFPVAALAVQSAALPSLCRLTQFKGFARPLFRSTQSLRWLCYEQFQRRKQKMFFWMLIDYLKHTSEHSFTSQAHK